MIKNIKVIAFDADDTLWINELYFHEAEMKFCALLDNYLPQEEISKHLLKTEMKNISLYGYGVKGFVLCMIETANQISNYTVSAKIINQIIELGHELLQKPVELLNGVPEVLYHLKDKYQLIVATKGDLLDQERKLKKTGLEAYFYHIEIMSDKNVSDYQKLLNHLNCSPENFLMLGNSIKSDILPILELGANAIHIPYQLTWAFEEQHHDIENNNIIQVKSIKEVLNFLK